MDEVAGGVLVPSAARAEQPLPREQVAGRVIAVRGDVTASILPAPERVQQPGSIAAEGPPVEREQLLHVLGLAVDGAGSRPTDDRRRKRELGRFPDLKAEPLVHGSPGAWTVVRLPHQAVDT